MQLSNDLKEKLLVKLLLGENHQEEKSSVEFWEIGKDYMIRTVTMIYLGVLKNFNDKELLFEDVAWIPETSRWNEFVNGAKPNEMEPYPNDVIIGRSALLDATVMTKKIKREVI
jgi:hypothetical protein